MKKIIKLGRKNDLEEMIDSQLANYTDSNLIIAKKNHWLNKAAPSEIYNEFFSKLEDSARAKLINEFKPHLTIRVGMGLGGGIDDETQKTIPTQVNQGVLYIPGGYKKEDLANAASRLKFLELLLSNISKDTLRIANSIGSSVGTSTRIYPVDKESLLADHPLKVKYKDARGGTGTFAKVNKFFELVNGPVIDYEAVNQDNVLEMLSLNNGLKEIRRLMLTGLPSDVPGNRIYELATGYFNGIYLYYNTKFK